MGVVYILSFVLIFCALLYELLIARMVSLWSVNNGIWYLLTCGIFLGAAGVGVRMIRREEVNNSSWKRLLDLECRMVVAGGFSALLLYSAGLGSLFLALSGYEFLAQSLFLGVAFIAAAAIGLCAGVGLSLLLMLTEEVSGSALKERFPGVFLMSYLGAFAAVISFWLVIFPHMSVMPACIVVAVLNVCAAWGVSLHYCRSSGRKLIWGLLILLTFFLYMSPKIDGYFTSKYYFSFQDQLSPVEFFKPRAYPGSIERRHSSYQQLDLVRADNIGNQARDLSEAFVQPSAADNKDLEGTVLFLNNVFQFAVSFERIYNEAFAHIPMSLLSDPPGKVLILGGRDGLLLREVLKYPQVKEVVLVDLGSEVVSVFKNNTVLAALNGFSFSDPRVRFVAGDGYQYVRRSREIFDIVFCDFLSPDNYVQSKLYSREFYALTRSRLKPDGLLVLSAPGIDTHIQGDSGDRSVLKVMGNTLYAAGFNSIRPFFSSLEEDNPEALKVLDGDLDALRGYLEGLRSGFLLASVVERSFVPRPLHVPGLRVMNNERVRLGLGLWESVGVDSDEQMVNSLDRPLLPLAGEWKKIRTAY